MRFRPIRWVVSLISLALIYLIFKSTNSQFHSENICQVDLLSPKLKSAIQNDATARTFYKHCIETKVAEYEFDDLLQSRNLLLNYKLLWSLLLEITDPIAKSEIQGIARIIEKSKLLDWYKPGKSIYKMYDSFKGKGIVMSVFDKWFATSYMSALQIRKIHKSDIPIYIFYNGDNDLSPKYQSLFSKIPNVKVLDLQDYIDPEKMKYKGFGNKAAMIFAAPCEECIFIDNDAWFLQHPEIAFHQSGYRETGLLLFKDRTKDSKSDGIPWVKALVPKSELPRLEQYRIFKGTTLHEAESGMVIINKRKRFIAMLAIAYMNEKSITRKSYSGFHGDKETFWIAPSMVKEPYAFDSHLPISIGHYDPSFKKGQFCSTQMAHLDELGHLLWIHGGVTTVKNDFNSELQHFEDWSKEVGEYKWYEKEAMICMQLNGNKVNKITPTEKSLIKKTQDLWITKVVPKLKI
ncbi:hypothetical protein HK103_003781 [Boothiomyces macroporosus]|uniref:Uncharacterized protein n=1 Tax=Boothiomyces macroporosus TaxID=261099 RepID=A0AAD5UKE9_9FUNG|nr:hypothetical protein HK103_003781 [Boothiomyces macroporosus]